MAQLIRVGPNTTVAGVGYVRQGVIHTVPDSMAAALIKSGEWAEVTRARVTEVPAPTPTQEPIKAAGDAESLPEGEPKRKAGRPKSKKGK